MGNEAKQEVIKQSGKQQTVSQEEKMATGAGSDNRKSLTGNNNSANEKPNGLMRLNRAASEFLSKAKDSVARLAKDSVTKVWSAVTWRGQSGTKPKDTSPPVVTLHTY